MRISKNLTLAIVLATVNVILLFGGTLTQDAQAMGEPVGSCDPANGSEWCHCIDGRSDPEIPPMCEDILVQLEEVDCFEDMHCGGGET